MNLKTAALAAGLAAAACSLTSAAGTSTAYLDQTSSGAGVCAASLPAFEGLVRKRPLALQNEGQGIAFVTCVPPQLSGNAGDSTYGITINVVNVGEATASVTCTGVSIQTEVPVYATKTVTIDAGGSEGIDFDEGDQGFGNSAIAVSCGLVPNTGIGLVYAYGNSFTIGPPPAP